MWMVWGKGWEDVIVKIDELTVHAKVVVLLQLTADGKAREESSLSTIEDTFW